MLFLFRSLVYLFGQDRGPYSVSNASSPPPMSLAKSRVHEICSPTPKETSPAPKAAPKAGVAGEASDSLGLQHLKVFGLDLGWTSPFLMSPSQNPNSTRTRFWFLVDSPFLPIVLCRNRPFCPNLPDHPENGHGTLQGCRDVQWWTNIELPARKRQKRRQKRRRKKRRKKRPNRRKLRKQRLARQAGLATVVG